MVGRKNSSDFLREAARLEKVERRIAAVEDDLEAEKLEISSRVVINFQCHLKFFGKFFP